MPMLTVVRTCSVRVASVVDSIGLRIRVRDLGRAVGSGFRQQHDELVAAVARDVVGIPQLFWMHSRAFEQAVAGFVTVGVVDRLQIVGIDHHHAERVAVARRLLVSALRDHVESAHVVDAGQLVGFRDQLDPRQRGADIGRQHGRDIGDQQHRRELRPRWSIQIIESDGRVAEENVTRGDQRHLEQRDELAQRQRRGDDRQQIKIDERAFETPRMVETQVMKTIITHVSIASFQRDSVR